MSSSYNWGAWAYAEVSSTDVDDTAVNDEATLTTDELDLAGAAACEVSVEAVEDNTGACDGDVLAYVLGEADNGWQTLDDSPPLACPPLDMAQNSTRRRTFSVNPQRMGGFKVLIDNDCGQQVTVSIQYRTATFDSA